MRPAGLRLLLGAVLVGSTLAAYAPVLGNEFVDFDDDHYILHNPALRQGLSAQGVRWAFTTGYGANWFPLTWLSWLADYEIHGLSARGVHATSLLIHAANVALLFHVLARATGAVWRAAFVAGVLGLHPLHVESVAWAAARKDVLSGLFWILATWAYLRYAERPGLGRHLLVSLLLLAGLLSKPMLVTLPFTLLLLDAWPLQRWRRGGAWPLVREKLPWLGLAVVSSVVTFLVQRASGAVAAIEAFPPAERIANALVSYLLYLRDAVWPAALAPYYPRVSVSLAAAVLSGLGLLALSLAAFAARRTRPALLLGWLFYLGTLVPVIGLVQVGEQSRADRYTYIPLIGAAIAVAWGVPWLLPPRAATLAGALGLGACIPLTARQAGLWHDSVTLFEHTLRVTAPNALAHTNLGIALLGRGRLPEATRELEAAVRLHAGSAEAHGALGEALARAGRHDDARTHFETSLRLFPAAARVRNAYGRSLAESGETGPAERQFREAIALAPELAEPYNNLGAVLLEQGAPDALDYIRRAVAIDPSLAEGRANLGRALLRQGQPREAAQQFQAAAGLSPDAVTLREWGEALLAAREFEPALARFQESLAAAPDDAEAFHGAGLALAHLGRYREAAAELARAAALAPKDAAPRHAWGMALASQGDLEGALEQYRQALRIDPRRAETHNSLGIALGSLGRVDEAAAAFATATALRPDYAEAFNNWGLALAASGRIAEAVLREREAVRLQPGYADARVNLGVFLARLGRLADAAAEFREALRLDPSRDDARGNLEKLLAAGVGR